VPKLTVATTFPLLPAHGGGPVRVLGLYGAVAALGVDVDVVTLGRTGERPGTTVVRPGLREIRVPQSTAHLAADRRLHAGGDDVPLTDVGFALHHRLTPGYADAVRASAQDAAAVVACHAYPAQLLRESAPALPLLYEAQDVETDLKAGFFRDPALLDVVRRHERLACREAQQILTCTADDGDRLGTLFGAPPERIVTVANGYDGQRTRHTPWEQRIALRRRVGVERFTVLFVGSWHEPNIEAAHAVIAAAEQRPAMHVLIVGSVGGALGDRPLPPNVDVLGAVPEGHLAAVLALADVAVNPMTSGSGTNIKMLTYAAAGVPLISSAFGARGLELVPDEHFVAAEPHELAAALSLVADEPVERTRARADRARRHVRERFEWRTIARRWLDHDPTGRLVAACG
jgi:glycosyltransferase involved in cell wall biosynthesis